MEELFNNLDNWTLIKLFGGSSIVLVSITIFISNLINQRIIRNWQKSSDIEITELKGKLYQNNSFISNLTSQVGQNFQKLLEKRIEASETYWANLIQMKSAIPGVIHLSFDILLEEELTVENLNKTKSNFGREISEISEIDFITNLTSFSEPIIKLRPFLSNRLWLIMYAYQGFIGRTVHLMLEGYRHNKIISWKRDNGINQIVKTVLTTKEFDYILNIQVYAYDSMLQLLENKAIEEIKKLISSQELANDSLDLLKQMSEIITQGESGSRK